MQQDATIDDKDTVVCPVGTKCMWDVINVIRPAVQNYLGQSMQEQAIMDSTLRGSFVCISQLDMYNPTSSAI